MTPDAASNLSLTHTLLTFNFSLLLLDWKQVQKMWKQFMDGLRRVAQRLSDFFDRLNRGSGTRSRGSETPPASVDPEEDMYTRRIAKGDEIYSKRTGRRIRPEEHGLTADGLPNHSWAVRTDPVSRNEGSRKGKAIPSHIPKPPVSSTNPVTETSSDRVREEIVTAAAKENEIRTGAGIPGNDSSVNNKKPEKKEREADLAKKKGTGIQITDV